MDSSWCLIRDSRRQVNIRGIRKRSRQFLRAGGQNVERFSGPLGDRVSREVGSDGDGGEVDVYKRGARQTIWDERRFRCVHAAGKLFLSV